MKQKDKAKSIMMQELREAQWIGEDGAMTCISSSKLGAFRKFKALMRGDVGDFEADEMEIENIGIGWFFLVTPEQKEDGRFEDADWYIDYKNESPYEVWVYNE